MGQLINGDDVTAETPLKNVGGDVPPLKYKRRKVSASRDFPECCGRNAARVNAKSDEACVVFINREFPEGCGQYAQVVNAKSKDDGNAVGSVKNSKVETERVLEESTYARQLGNFVSVTLEVAESSVQIESPHLRNALMSETTESSDILDQVETPKPLTSLEPVVVESPKSLEMRVLVNPSQKLEAERTDLLKNLNQTELLDSIKNKDAPLESKDLSKNASQPGEKELPSSFVLQLPLDSVLPDTMVQLKVSDLPQESVPVGAVEGSLHKNYPPRRRISASRDFPPHCGRNAPHVIMENCKSVDSCKDISVGNEKFSGENRGEQIVRAFANRKEEKVQDEDVLKSKLLENITKGTGDRVRVKMEREVEKEMVEHIHVTEVFECKLNQEDTLETSTRSPRENIISELDLNPSLSIKADKLTECFEEKLGMESVKLGKDLSLERKSSGKFVDESHTINLFQGEKYVGLESSTQRVVVQALMAAPNCPWRQGKQTFKSPTELSRATVKSKGKKHEYVQQDNYRSISWKEKDEAEKSEVKYTKKQVSPTRKVSYESACQLALKDEEDDTRHHEEDNSHLVQKSQNMELSLIPFGLQTSIDKDDDGEANITRNKVRETLRLFQAIVRKLLQDEESKSKEVHVSVSKQRVDLVSAKKMKENNKWVNTGKQILGPVPGVEVGDEFHYRVELAIIGLHRPFQGGIDYLKRNGKILATSIVASGGYADDMDSSDVLVYSGQGGNPTGGDKKVEDQKLERGNLSLKNSIDEGTPVRVIRGFKETKGGYSLDSRAKMVATYTYDGLYLVENYWQEKGRYGTNIFKFQLRRIHGQPELAIKEVKKSKKAKIRQGLCVDDISRGKEKMPIAAVNTMDDEKPPPFEYITKMIYPSWYNLIPPRGCGCTDGCSDSDKCFCAVKNGGEIPFNYNGAIVEAKSLVYECGPSCKCPPSCHNRVSQHGIKFQLEIFKTESRGWGVRSLTSISSGSFICEYTGELLDDKEAEQRTSNDEYLFDIGHNYNDHGLWDGLSNLIPLGLKSTSCETPENADFTIDALQYGSIGRFINHSCSPNLYAQNVLYDHDDKRMPHIMLFAAENIPPLQELTYHYNYELDQVRDSNGNIRKKNCYCGSTECTGRMY